MKLNEIMYVVMIKINCSNEHNESRKLQQIIN